MPRVFPTTAAPLLQEDFESGLEKRGKNGEGAPETAVIVQDSDPAHGNVLQTQGCIGGGDAFSMNTMDCSIAAPCLVEYDAKGRIWQGFSDGYPANHIWTATPTSYEGQHVQTVHDTSDW